VAPDTRATLTAPDDWTVPEADRGAFAGHQNRAYITAMSPAMDSTPIIVPAFDRDSRVANLSFMRPNTLK
jgi:hypothetical protein